MTSTSNYSVTIPAPDISALEQLAQFTTPDGLVAVYSFKSQVVLEFNDQWYIQNDRFVTDSVSEVLGIKESVINVKNLCVGYKFDPSTFRLAESEIADNIYKCMWSDYTCDNMLMQADLEYPYDD